MFIELNPLNEITYDFYKKHKHYHEGDSGLDLYCPDDILVKKGETVKIDLQIKCAAYKDKSKEKWSSYYLYPRSSIIKTPLRMANSVGIIDSGYRGNLLFVVDNIKSYDYLIRKGERLCQICSPTLDVITFSLVDKLDKTKRGENGFGSTGK